VLAHALTLGEVAEVHVNNMRRQTAARSAALAAEGRDDAKQAVSAARTVDAPPKPVGFVTVAVGDGLKAILASLGADVIVNGGQTMNPSTKELADAVERVNAEKVIVLPNNKNILLAAGAAATVATKPVAVVPTRSVPQAFSALLAFDGNEEFDDLVAEMTEAASSVRTGEITTAVKAAKGKTGDIAPGQVIGIVDDEDIEAVGDDVADVALRTARAMVTQDTETLTLFAGEELDDTGLASISAALQSEFPQLVVETHRGEQPLYPLVMSAE
jgi:hypothetical protein